MCYGKPMILVPTPSHTEQLNNAKQAGKLGVAKIIEQKRLNKQKLLESARQILESEIPEKLKQVQKEVMEYNGLENAVRAIIETAEKPSNIKIKANILS